MPSNEASPVELFFVSIECMYNNLLLNHLIEEFQERHVRGQGVSELIGNIVNQD